DQASRFRKRRQHVLQTLQPSLQIDLVFEGWRRSRFVRLKKWNLKSRTTEVITDKVVRDLFKKRTWIFNERASSYCLQRAKKCFLRQVFVENRDSVTRHNASDNR